jgi:hypothetical protein
LPDLLIRAYERVGAVKRLEVRGWESEGRSLFLAVRSDLISEKRFQLISQLVKSTLN